ncbi:MAG: patatin-like phospholipase family protein [Acidimicrobiia bacterium]
MTSPEVAFVLGGGGHRGAYEVGMLKALTEQGIRPDVVLGTSIGAVNGAVIARTPNTDGVAMLERTWIDLNFADVFPGSLWNRAMSAVRQRTYLHANDQLREWLESLVDDDAFDDLAVAFQCVAACIEDAAEQWFDSGSLIDAILASSAVPGLLPPVEIAGKHFVDGGVVNSIPVSRAYELGAKTIYVMHVGHVDDALEVPSAPWDVAVVAFEIARRHRFASDVASVPEGTTVHVLPTGAERGRYNDPSKLQYGKLSEAREQIDSAHKATLVYLTGPDHSPTDDTDEQLQT